MSFLKITVFAAATALMSTSYAGAQMITKTSPHSVKVTIDRLEAAVNSAGATVFARVDHAKGAASVGEDLRPTQMLLFGNPKLGSPLMQAQQSIGLDLPLRVVSFEDADGNVHVVYQAPADVAAAHGVSADTPVLVKMTGALDKRTNKAIAAE
jgi:uncharacterized protein (DUF302 family)